MKGLDGLHGWIPFWEERQTRCKEDVAGSLGRRYAQLMRTVMEASPRKSALLISKLERE